MEILKTTLIIDATFDAAVDEAGFPLNNWVVENII